MRRSQIGLDPLVGLGMLALVAFIVLALIFPEVREVLVGSGEKGACEWSLVLHSLTKLSDFSLVPAECRAVRIEVTLEDLKANFKEAKRRIDTYKSDPVKYKDILRYFNDYSKSDAQLYEWSLNKIVAQEMNDCWDKVFKGQFPLFDEWWKLYSWGSATPPDNRDEAFAMWAPGGPIRAYGPPTNCIVCSRIKFSDTVKKQFIDIGKPRITTLDVWMKYNYPRLGGDSYYKLLTEGRSSLTGLFGQPFEYDVDVPLAVLYEKIYVRQAFFDWLDKAWTAVFGGTRRDATIDNLKLVPYTQEKLIGPHANGGEACSFVLD